jgi:hypothetical protein
MPAIEIQSPEQYSQALKVLTEVGGTFHGVGAEENRSLLVTEAQYEALVAAGVVKKDGTKDRSRGPKKARRSKAARRGTARGYRPEHSAP